MRHVRPEIQLVLAASAPDTDEIAGEVDEGVAALAAERTVVHLQDQIDRPEVITLLSSASLFVCPSVYEPLGIVNLEAMACETAVVASDVGGIPEVVDDGETGRLVHYDPDDTDGFEADLAAAIDDVLSDSDRLTEMGRAGRERAVADFAWPTIAERTVELYTDVVETRRKRR
jgi:starch synthase